MLRASSICRNRPVIYDRDETAKLFSLRDSHGLLRPTSPARSNVRLNLLLFLSVRIRPISHLIRRVSASYPTPLCLRLFGFIPTDPIRNLAPRKGFENSRSIRGEGRRRGEQVPVESSSIVFGITRSIRDYPSFDALIPDGGSRGFSSQVEEEEECIPFPVVIVVGLHPVGGRARRERGGRATGRGQWRVLVVVHRSAGI